MDNNNNKKHERSNNLQGMTVLQCETNYKLWSCMYLCTTHIWKKKATENELCWTWIVHEIPFISIGSVYKQWQVDCTFASHSWMIKTVTEPFHFCLISIIDHIWMKYTFTVCWKWMVYLLIRSKCVSTSSTMLAWHCVTLFDIFWACFSLESFWAMTFEIASR